MPTFKTETSQFDLRDHLGKTFAVTLKRKMRLDENNLLGAEDIWEEHSRTYSLADGTPVKQHDLDTFSALTQPATRLTRIPQT